MPRLRRTPKGIEKYLITEFLQLLGYRISKPVWGDRPDGVLTVSKAGTRLRVGLELTGYYVDAVPGVASPGAELAEVWERVQDSLVARISHMRGNRRRVLSSICATVRLRPALEKPRKGERGSVARALAAELVEIAEASRLPVGGSRRLCRFAARYPMLQAAVQSLRLCRTGVDAYICPRFNWGCSNAAFAWLSLETQTVEMTILAKSKKSRTYAWGNCGERWLVVAAAGRTIFNCAGPWRSSIDWSYPALRAICSGSGFHRIFFWERSDRWCKPVWPEAPVVHFA